MRNAAPAPHPQIKISKRTDRPLKGATKTRRWSARQRAQQAAHARRTQPWAHATGPRTPSGKSRSAQNAFTHGLSIVARALRAQARFLRNYKRELEQASKKPDVSIGLLQKMLREQQRLRGLLQVRGSVFAALGRNFVRNALAFVERAHAGFFNRADVNEHIAAAVVRLDETETFLRIEPFNCTCCHDGLLE